MKKKTPLEFRRGLFFVGSGRLLRAIAYVAVAFVDKATGVI